MNESTVARKLRAYSYSAHVEILAQTLPEICGTIDFGRDDDGYSKLLTLLGAVLRITEGSEEARLSDCIKQHMGLAKPQHVVRPGIVTNGNDEDMNEDLQGDRSRAPSLAQYFTFLKEYGDRTGHKLDFRVDCIAFQPVPRFEAILTFKGVEFSGRARTKKEARHLAAKYACGTFGIRS